MIKAAFKNYYKNWRYLFVAMGVIYLAILITLFVITQGVIDSLKESINASFTAIEEYVSANSKDITFKSVFTENYLSDFIKGLAGVIRSQSTLSKAQMASILGSGLAFIILSCTIANKMCVSLIRKDAATKKTRKGILIIIARFIISLGFILLLSYLTFLWFFSIVIGAIVYLIFKAFENLFVTWYIYFRNRPLKNIVNFRNAIRLIKANFITILINVALIFVIASFLNIFLGVLLAIPLFVYNYSVMDTVAVEYFKENTK